MTTFTFGDFPVHMQADDVYMAALYAFFPSDDIDLVSMEATQIIGRDPATGASYTILGNFDFSSLDAFMSSTLSGFRVTTPTGALLGDARGLHTSLEALLQMDSEANELAMLMGGADRVTSGAANDLLRGFGGNDTLDGGRGADTMLGGAGNDTYVVDHTGDRVYETTTIGGGIDAGGTDTVHASVSFAIGDFVEKLVLTGSGRINGTGNSRANSITGNSADNVLTGNAGNDTLIGIGGNDALKGGSGSDTLKGGSGNDRLEGGSGNDRLEGSIGNDTLIGGTGNDTLVGGSGQDAFRFNTAPDATTNRDKITDFVVVDDTIQLENAVFTSLAVTGTLARGLLRSGAGVTQAADANDYLIYNSSSGALYYDADGSGHAYAPVQFATLSAGLALTASDFFVT